MIRGYQDMAWFEIVDPEASMRPKISEKLSIEEVKSIFDVTKTEWTATLIEMFRGPNFGVHFRQRWTS